LPPLKHRHIDSNQIFLGTFHLRINAMAIFWSNWYGVNGENDQKYDQNYKVSLLSFRINRNRTKWGNGEAQGGSGNLGAAKRIPIYLRISSSTWVIMNQIMNMIRVRNCRVIG
jgi:hypothetical protein